MEVTDSMLSKQATTLETAGYMKIRKATSANRGQQRGTTGLRARWSERAAPVSTCPH
jgi:hypothetical protein